MTTLERLVHMTSRMTITMGQLVSEVFEAYERRYGDTELAAVATQVTVEDVMRANRKRPVRVRKAA
jgi:RNase P/RNase MRP subunit POP5